MQRFPAPALRRQILDVLLAWGMPQDRAGRTAAIMVDADLRGIDSHGISMLPTYERKHAAGHLNLAVRPEIIHDEGRAVAVIDAHHGLGHVPAQEATTLACERARRFGIGLATVRNSHHFGAAGHYARQAAHDGYLALVTTSAATLTQTPTGGRERRLGTNPLAFAAPASGRPPFVLDMSTTIAAVNKVKTYALNGSDLPADWVVDANGIPIRDSTRALDLIRNHTGGGLTPLGGAETATGGHKGYGLAVMVQLLSSALSGAALPRAATQAQPDNIGHTIIAIAPTAFGQATTPADYTSSLIDLMHATAPLDPAHPVQVAGDPEERAYQERRAEGIPMSRTLLAQLLELCDRHHIRVTLTA